MFLSKGKKNLRFTDQIAGGKEMEGLEKYSLRPYLIPFQVGLLAEWKILHLHYQGKFYITQNFRFLSDFRVSIENAEFARNKKCSNFRKKRQNLVKNAQIP